MNTITQLADAHPFNKDYTVEIPATGRPVRVDAAGLFFMASDSTTAFPFDMSFDGQSWFRWNVGLALPWPTGFKSVWFRSLDGVAVTLIFYAGNLPLTDSRLTIVRDPNHYQLFNFQVAPTLTKAFETASIAGGDNVIFPGRGTVAADPVRSAGADFSFRKAIIITNRDPGSDLEIYTLKPAATAFTANGDGTYKVDSLTDAVRVATVFLRQAWLGESNADLVVANETGTAIAVRVVELFYPNLAAPSVTP